jgi:hypothetical protein
MTVVKDTLMVIGIILLIITIIIIVDAIFFMFCYNMDKIWRPSRYKNSFLIENYKYTSEDKNIIEKGKKRAENTKMVIYTLCRNISKEFDKSKKQLEDIGKLFKEYKIIVFENDSNDNSRDLLKNWTKENKNIILLDCCDKCLFPLNNCYCDEEKYNCKLRHKKGYDIGVVSSSRVHMMKNHRNKCLEYIKNNFSNYDYVGVFDFDIEGGILKSGIYHSIGLDNWDAIFANGRSPLPPFSLNSSMYDSFAYRSENNDNESTVKKWFKMIKLKSKVGDKLIPVKSAFNGFGIYKLNSTRDSKYKIMNSPLNCEHVGLHDDMYKKGFNKMYINPNMLLFAGFQGPSNRWKAFKEMM